MLAIFSRIVIFVAILVVIGLLIPAPITAQMSSALSYFAANICSLGMFVHTATLLNAIKILFNFLAAMMLFVMCYFFVKFTGGTK